MANDTNPVEDVKDRAVSNTVHHTTFTHPDKSTGSYTEDALKYGILGALLSGAAGAGVGSLSNHLKGSPQNASDAALAGAGPSAALGGVLGALGGLVSRKLENDEEQSPGKGVDMARKINRGENTLIGGLAGSTLGSLLYLFLNKDKPMSQTDMLKYVGGGGAAGAGLGYFTSPHQKDKDDFYREHVKQAKWERAGDVLQEITAGKPYPLSYATGEMKELGEEIMGLNLPGIREEGSDVAYALNMLLHQSTGLNHPMIGGKYALNKFRKRNSVWKNLMEENGVNFHVDHLAGGSNFHKPHKIQTAFAAAGKELSDEEAQLLSQQAVDMEKEANSKAYTISGERTQGIGLRKSFHQILADHGLKGLAVNNPESKQVDLIFNSDDHDSILQKLVDSKKDRVPDIGYQESEEVPDWEDVELDKKQLEELRDLHYKAWKASEMYDPDNDTKTDLDTHKREMVERYLLEANDEGLSGRVPARAARQLRGEELPYDWMVDPGGQELEKQAAIPQKELLRHARKEIDQDPTEAQIEAGNYKKGHVDFKGMKITLENGKGHTRSGTSSQGTKWSVKLKHDYGYFPGTTGKDGDEVDVFVGDDLDSDNVYVVNQTFGNKFDEHKVMVGFKDMVSAKKGYLSNYERGWKGMGTVVKCSIQEFKDWLKTGDKKKPYKYMKKHAYYPLNATGGYVGSMGRNALYGGTLGGVLGTLLGSMKGGVGGDIVGSAVSGGGAGLGMGSIVGALYGALAERNRRKEEERPGSGLASAERVDKISDRGVGTALGGALGMLGGGAIGGMTSGDFASGALTGLIPGLAGGYFLSPMLRSDAQDEEDYGSPAKKRVYEFNKHLERGGDPDEFLAKL